MKKNYRRKNPRPCTSGYYLPEPKKLELKQRVKKRRRRDRDILQKTLLDEEAWESIRAFEKPVDWWNID